MRVGFHFTPAAIALIRAKYPASTGNRKTPGQDTVLHMMAPGDLVEAEMYAGILFRVKERKFVVRNQGDAEVNFLLDAHGATDDKPHLRVVE
jgi:hypothetical protein